ncbi:SPW repeat protein [Microtetraspora sp. NBRC 16547]|uniref:SPW repeat protein n=1 Tax=Microtetraspora sp. NBRC 16547 TaxID=3030993 RepID=UPI0025538FB1|nr:SPW repeat protein [Microtetraspora sp. NBRC 16547]
MSHSTDIGQHPDIMEMRARYEAAAANPTAQLTDGLALLAGIYLAVSPWICGFQGLSGITVNNLVTGILVALLALGFSSAYGRTYGLAWVAPVIGVWTIIAPWVISGPNNTARVIVSNVVIGAIILFLGLANMSTGMTATRRHAPRFAGTTQPR